jgi:hypothetical protein
VFSSGWGLGSNLPHVRAVNHTRRRDIQRIYTRLALTRWDGSRWDLIGLSDVFKAVAGDDAYVTHWRSVVDGRVQETAGRILWNINQTGFYKVFTRVRWYGNGRSWKTKPYWRSLSHASHDGSNFCTIN